MSLVLSADGSDAPPEASPGSGNPAPAVATPSDPAARQDDERPVQVAATAEPKVDPADTPAVMRPVDAISTADALHWFG
jgi:hypothetical protein